MLFCILPTATHAIDLTTIDRSIKKEPSYQTQPRYCLLVLGKEARTRVWLVVDGHQLYIDRNGNGDLTERGERIRRIGYGPSFKVDRIREAARATVHKDLRLSVFDKDQFYCSIELANGGRQSAGYNNGGYGRNPRLATRPQDAPIIHFAPITFANRTSIFLPRDPGCKSFRTMRVDIGNSGLGRWTTTRIDCGTFLEQAGEKMVTADFEFPSHVEGGEPITRRDHFKLKD